MKKPIQYIIIIILILAIVYLSYFKIYPMIVYKTVIKKALTKYSRAIVENAERVFRLETNHFKSGQFLRSFSPGMEKASNTYPYGWNSFKTFWNNNPSYKPTGFISATETGTGITKYFLKFQNFEGGFFTMCEFLKNHENNPGRWFSLDASKQATYNASIVKFIPTITNEIV